MRILIIETNIDSETEKYNPNNDIQRSALLSDTRKPYLTLKHLNKLKKIRKLRYVERQKQLKNIEAVYGVKEEI